MAGFDRLGVGSVGGNGSSKCINIWTYKTDDAKAVVIADDYFAPIAKLVKVGDRIMVGGDLDGTPEAYDLVVIKVVTTKGAEEVDTLYTVIA